MVISYEDADYLASVMDLPAENDAVITSERSISSSNPRNGTSLGHMRLADSSCANAEGRDDSVESMDYMGDLSQESMVLHGAESAKVMCEDRREEMPTSDIFDKNATHEGNDNHSHAWKSAASGISITKPKKKKGLLRRMRPKQSKSELTSMQVASLKTSTEDTNGNSMDGLCSSNTQPLGRPPIPPPTFPSEPRSYQNDNRCVVHDEYLTTVDDGATTVSIMTVERDFEVKIENSDDNNKDSRLKQDALVESNNVKKSVRQWGSVSEDSSVATEKRKFFRRSRSRTKKETEQVDVGAESTSSGHHSTLRLTRHSVHEMESVKGESSEKMKRNEEQVDARRGLPDILLPVNQLEHVSSDITFNSYHHVQAAMGTCFPNDVTRSSSQAQKNQTFANREHGQNHKLPSPAYEALQYARSQAIRMNTERFCHNDQATTTSNCSGNDPKACGIKFMRILDPEWDDSVEFGKGRRNSERTDDMGDKVTDLLQILGAHFACTTFKDVMDSSNSNCKNVLRQTSEPGKGDKTRPESPIEALDVKAREAISALRSLRSQITCGTNDVANDVHSECTQNRCNVELDNSHSNIVTEEEECKLARNSGNRRAENNDGNSNISVREQGPKIRYFETYDEETLTNIADENDQMQRMSETHEYSSTRSDSFFKASCAQESQNKRGAPTLKNVQKEAGKTGLVDDESQMIYSYFSGDTPRINNQGVDAFKGRYRRPFQKNVDEVSTERELQETATARKQTVKRQIERVANLENKARSKVKPGETVTLRSTNRTKDETIYLIEEPSKIVSLQQHATINEEEESTFTTVSKEFPNSKTTSKHGQNKVSDVQLVLSASSTLELPKHKRSKVIRFAVVPAEIKYEQALPVEQVEVERRNGQKKLQLSTKAAMPSLYMDHFDPCLRIFDPALDACDKFCTRSPSIESDDECSIASTSIHADPPKLGLRQRAYNYMKETPIWPRSGGSRKLKSIQRLP